MRFACRVHALGHVPQLQQNFIQGFALGQLEAHLAIAGKFAGAGEDQVAHAGQPHDGLGMAAQGSAQACHFSGGPGDEGSAGIVAKAQAVGNAGSNGHDVL